MIDILADPDRLSQLDPLAIESLEAEYYLRGTTGKGMDAADAGTNPGPGTGGRQVPWTNDDLREFMKEVAANELAHVRFYRRTLGNQAVPRPAIDLTGFAAAAKAAGLGDNLDPFENEMNFFLGGMLMEDLRIVYLTDKPGVSAGGLFPKGMNGTVRST
jgi:hypothetical protein